MKNRKNICAPYRKIVQSAVQILKSEISLPSRSCVDTAIWTLTKRMEKKLDGNYTRKLRAILNKSWRQTPTNQQLYGHLPPITKIMKIRRTRHAGLCWRSRDELTNDVLPWTSSHGRSKAGWPARTYLQQFCAHTGCNLKTSRKQWKIETGGEKGSGISVLMALHHHDDKVLYTRFSYEFLSLRNISVIYIYIGGVLVV